MAPATFRLATGEGRGGVACDATGLFVGATPLLERARDPDGAHHWRPRPVADLNDELSRLYGFRVDCGSKAGGLATVARDLDCGDLVHAQVAALHLRLPDPPPLAKSALASDEVLDLARRLAASGLLKWDSTQHPRQPAGSPDSAGGQFAPVGEADGPPSAAAQVEAGGRSSPTTAPAREPQRSLHFAETESRPDGTIAGNFILIPPSKIGGAIVQKVTITDRLYGRVVGKPRLGWEAWIVDPGAISPLTEGEANDTWRAPQNQSPRPSVATVRTVTAEATFYEGLTKRDLIEIYGFQQGGSGFSGGAISTVQQPRGLPTEGVSATLRRSREYLVW